MSKEFVRNVLHEDARNHVPIHPNLWPVIHNQVRLTTSATSLQVQQQPRRLHLRRGWAPLLLGSALAFILLAAGALALLTRPAPVSAEEIIARAEQVAQGNTVGLQSFQGNYLFQYRSDPNGPFVKTRQETWFQAPNKYAYKLTTSSASGQGSVVSNGADGIYSYNYVSESNQLRLYAPDMFPGDPTTGTLQALLFSPANLSDALERARRKIPPPLNPKSAPRPPYMYDVKLVGTEGVLGRSTYVLEMTLVPGASVQLPYSQVPEKMKMWVDQEMYAVLRIEGWDATGNILQSGIYESFQVNLGAQIDIRSLVAPKGADIIDLRPADAKEVDGAWQDVAQHAPYQVLRPSSIPEELIPARPLYDSDRQVISQVYQGQVVMQVLPLYAASTGEFTVLRPVAGYGPSTRRATLPKLVITQGPPASIKEEGFGQSAPIQMGNLTGRFYSGAGASILIFDRSGTRIKLYAPAYMIPGSSSPSTLTREQLMTIAEAMQPVSEK